MASNMISFEAF